MVEIDHKSNIFLDTKPVVQLSSRQVRWQQLLCCSHFEWEYCKSCCNVADPISRCPALHAIAAENIDSHDGDVSGSVTVSFQFLQSIRDEHVLDPHLADEQNTSESPFVVGGKVK